MTRNLIIAAVVVAALVAAIYMIEHKGHVEGEREAKLETVTEQNVELRETKRALDAMHRDVEAKERKSADDAAEIAKVHLKEKNNVEAERDRALADVRAGRLKLRNLEARAAADVVCMPAPGASPAGGEPATQEAGLPGEREAAVVSLLADANGVVVELNKCWRTVRKDRGMPEPVDTAMGESPTRVTTLVGADTTAARRSPADLP